jgi:energy-coupling factor transporter transmembrane protein EcfT
MISIVSIKAYAAALSLLSFVLIVMLIHAEISLKSVIKTIRYVFLLLVFIFIARAFSSPGSPVIEFGGISVNREGIYDGAMVCWRLLVVIVMGLSFISTTRSSEIKTAVEWFLGFIPFIPAKRTAVMMSLLMRFIPVILDQAKETGDAQRARGVENRKNPVYRMIKFGIPLMRRTFERADKLAVAMEARCYSEDRTDPELTSERNDWITLVFVIGLSVVMIVL